MLGEEGKRNSKKLYGEHILKFTAEPCLLTCGIIHFPFLCGGHRACVLKGGHWRLRRTGLGLTRSEAALERLFHFENVNVKEILFDVKKIRYMSDAVCKETRENHF